jgi:hypothetical protein
VLALCLASTALCAASPTVMLRLPLPFGYLMSVCGVYETSPRTRIGVFWISPFFSSVYPLAVPSRPCVVIPWLPALPQRGEITLPS